MCLVSQGARSRYVTPFPAVRRRFPVRPLARTDTEPGHPMNVEAALAAVEGQRPEFALGSWRDRLVPNGTAPGGSAHNV
jgi:hypothetical protein